MRAIGHLPDEASARTLTDFLLVQGIPNQVEREEDGRWTLWIHEDDHLPKAQEALTAFLQNPKDSKYRGAAPTAQELREKEEQDQKAWRKRFFERGSLWPGGSGRLGWLTTTLITISASVAALQFLRGPDDPLINGLYITHFTTHGNLISYVPGLHEIRSGQIWRVFTPIFLHFGLLHLLGNMLWLMDLGNQIEARSGAGKLAIMVIVIAAVSNLSQYFYNGPLFGGMSGVVYGLFGYIWMRSKFDPRCALYLSPSDVMFMIIWLFACTTGWVGPIANVAHFTGLGLGMLWGFLGAKLNV
jgi:GlpG protein